MSNPLDPEGKVVSSTSQPATDNCVAKEPFEEPRLAYVEPELTKRGDAKKITAGFFGSFSP